MILWFLTVETKSRSIIKDGGIDRFEMSIYGSWGKLSNESVLSKSILATLILSENTPVTL